MDVIFRSPRGMMKDGKVILDYDLSEVDALPRKYQKDFTLEETSLLGKLGCYPNPITAEQLFRHAGLKTSADFLSTRGWFTDVLYEMVINQVDNYSYKEYYDYNRKLESEARRKHLRIVK